jgi:nuclear protein localization family protein 4
MGVTRAQQSEEEVLAQVATTINPEVGNKLLQTPGWQTLITILKESGGSPPQHFFPSTKRPFSSSGSRGKNKISDKDAGNNYHGAKEGNEEGEGENNHNNSDERLTKRLRGVSLKEKFSILR